MIEINKEEISNQGGKRKREREREGAGSQRAASPVVLEGWKGGRGAYNSMRKCYHKDSNVRDILEDGQWHQRILGEVLLAVNESRRHQASKNNEADDLRRIPSEHHPTKIQTQQEHHHQSQN
jgi:hypothetical protein